LTEGQKEGLFKSSSVKKQYKDLESVCFTLTNPKRTFDFVVTKKEDYQQWMIVLKAIGKK
jgi:hypothetical protein